MQFNSIGPIDRTLSGTTTSSQSGHGSDGNKGVLPILQSSSITETSSSDCLVSYRGYSLVGDLTPLQRSSRCILQHHPIEPLVGKDLTPLQRSSQCILQPSPQPTGPLVVGGVLPLCREAVGVFYSTLSVDWANRCRGSFTPLQRSSRCILQPHPIEPLVGKDLTPLQRSSQCILQPPLSWLGHSL